MDHLLSAYLGILQGLTEFLPVSSSGHLALSQILFKKAGLDLSTDDLFMDVLLHIGTLVAVTFFFRTELRQFVQEWTGWGSPVQSTVPPGACKKWTLYVVLSTLVTTALAVPFEDQIEMAFQSLLPIGLSLLFTSAILLVAWNISKRSGNGSDLTLLMALIIGGMQAVAVLPGVSRSGTTIATALILGMRRSEAVTFSFLLSIPAILGGAILHARKVENISWSEPLIGMVCAAVFGWIALRWLVNVVLKGKLVGFSIYCFCVGIFALLLSFLD